VDVSGPGFINIRVRELPMRRHVCALLTSGVRAPIDDAHTHQVIVDFSSPNIAKEMHVGHLRSTIIGDSMARLYEYCNYRVLRLNHIGDWGTQFGMLIAHLEDTFPDYNDQPPPLTDLFAFYKQSKKRFDEDDAFKRRAMDNVVRLQAGDARIRHAWAMIVDLSRTAYQEIYSRLHIRIEERGESFYQPFMADIVKLLTGEGDLRIHNASLIGGQV
jgi:arginyl-tRNA synthetase